MIIHAAHPVRAATRTSMELNGAYWILGLETGFTGVSGRYSA